MVSGHHSHQHSRGGGCCCDCESSATRLGGLAAVLLMVFVTLFLSYTMSVLIFWPLFEFSLLGFIFNLIWYVLLLLTWMAHLRTMLADPGFVVVSRDVLGADVTSWSTCRKCNTPRPPLSHHCGGCRRCVLKMDHHCPWVNNCVGLFNQRFFLLFLFWVTVTALFGIIFGSYNLYRVYYSCDAGNDVVCAQTEHIWIFMGIHFFFCMGFLAFTSGMGITQLSSIVEDIPYIESLNPDHLPSVRAKMTPAEARVHQDRQLRAFLGPMSPIKALNPFHRSVQREQWMAEQEARLERARALNV